MARKTGCFRTGETTELRSIAGVIAADAAAGLDAATPPADAIDCSGYETVFIGVEVEVPGTSTMTIEALFYDPESVDGSRWSRALLGAADGITALAALAAETTGALPGTGASFAELRVFGHSKVYFRVTAVANTGGTLSSKVLGRPGRVRGDRRLNAMAIAGT